MTLNSTRTLNIVRGALLSIAATIACGASLADKPEWAGGGKSGKGGKHEQLDRADRGNDGDEGGKHGGKGKKGDQGDRRDDIRVGGFFGDQQRVAAREYYGREFESGHCPPGLAKKHNGCMPPGQAKKYFIGQPLPRGVIFYPVPAPVVLQLGVAPAGYKYVRVASDILLIAIGSSMVVDAIQDLNRL